MDVSQNSLSKKHTLHMPIRNRPKWLEYTLKMYKMYNYSGVILLADDSDDEIYNQNKSITNSLKNELIINHFRPKNNVFSEKHRRYNLTKYQSYKQIDTEFYSCTCDDDLFYTNFAFDGIKYLENNLDYSAVTGAEMKLFYDNKFYIKNSFVKWWPTSKFDDPLDRLLDYTFDPSAAYLGVCRTSSLKDIFDLEKQNKGLCFVREGDDFGFPTLDIEIPWMLQLYISGKIGRIYNKLSSFRGEHNSEDRYTYEHLQKKKNNKSSSIYGPIIEILNDSASKSLNKTYNDLLFLVTKKSNYKKEIVEDVILRCLWKILTRFSYLNVIDDQTEFGKKFILEKKLFKTFTFRYVKFSNVDKKKIDLINLFLNQLYRKVQQVKFNFAKINFNKIKSMHLKKHSKLRNILEK